jgi:two-component system, OmpR family, sensor histidine kinase SenX3
LLSLGNRFVRNVKPGPTAAFFAYSSLVRRTPWQLLAAALLLVLLAILATLQYRWLGEVSEAERERMRASLRTRASELAQEFDAELTRAYVAFHVGSDQLDANAAATLADAYARWQAGAKIPALVSAVYIADGRMLDSAELRRLDPAARTLTPIEWPPELSAALARTHQGLPQVVGGPPSAPSMLFADAIDSRTPALLIAVPRFKRSTENGRIRFISDPAAGARLVIVTLDAGQLQRQLLEPLVAKYFGVGSGSEYLVTIARPPSLGPPSASSGGTGPPSPGPPSASSGGTGPPSLGLPSTSVGATSGSDEIVYNSAPTPIEASKADVTTGLFDLRMDELSRLVDEGARGGSPPPSARMSIAIVRRSSGADGRRVLVAGGEPHGAWEMRLSHRTGSLDTIVAQSRRRNLGISLGVLGLLAASFVLVLASAERQQRLSRQQMEFVAAVSHELRTPLAVICSAGENLADGVVAETTQVRRYGSLIETEGRRLGDMVERVMAFAGMSSGAQAPSHASVDVAQVIAGAVEGVQHDARDRGVTIAVHSNGTLPPVSGDAEALRSAVQNVVGNAVKYSAGGATVDVASAVRGAQVEIRVVDRGLGIDANDLPHIFKPFYRGRRAMDAQVRGSGVGLSVVRHVVDAHRGTIQVDSRPGEGTTVTIALPVTM